ncbi:MAG: hypothetical protein EXS37_00725 [Opitutus sp.]|nr:hypothetical protein [Opitutus sp.]
MSGSGPPAAAAPRAAGWGPAAVFLLVGGAQLWLVARAGTDIPFHDQWDVEGRWLYPACRDDTLSATALLRAHNEHRIVWTHLLNLALFAANGQWDPLVQLAAGAGLRAAIAAGLVWRIGRDAGGAGGAIVAAGVTLAFLPQLAWHNALWGFQSQVYFVLLFSLAALALLGGAAPSRGQQAAGLIAGIAALFAMGAGAFVPMALLGLFGLRAIGHRRIDAAWWRGVWPAGVLLALALALRAEVPEHAALRATTAADFFNALGRALAWPHSGDPLAAFGLNLPIVFVVAARLARRRRAAPGEDFVLLLGGWAVLGAVAAAWARGGGGEFAAGVPSRYVDLFVLLPLANAWCVVVLAHEAADRWRGRARGLAAVWGAFLLVGWIGLSAEAMRGVIRPRARDREAPVRLMQTYQATGDAGVFAGQPRLLVPHPNPASVRAVLADPRLRGALPPSLQPERPMGPLSRAVRWILGR